MHDEPSPGAVFGVIWARFPGPRVAKSRPTRRIHHHLLSPVTAVPRGSAPGEVVHRVVPGSTGDPRPDTPTPASFRDRITPESITLILPAPEVSFVSEFYSGCSCLTQNTLVVPFKDLWTFEFLGITRRR